MKTQKKIEILKKLVEKANDLENLSETSPQFSGWKNQVESNFSKIFGENSIELEQLRKLKFSYIGMTVSGNDYSQVHNEYYIRSLDTLIHSIQNNIEDLQSDLHDSDNETMQVGEITKIFISHSSLDKIVVEELIEILETIGLSSSQIFCTSFEGYGIDFGQNFLERIKEELNHKVLVLFVLSKNFYESPVCLCEMGATWMKTNSHIPILIPPFDFTDVKGVIPLTHGFKIDNKDGLNQFKSQIETLFKISKTLDIITWERKRNRLLNRISRI